MKTDIMGITFDNVTMQQALERAGEILRVTKPAMRSRRTRRLHTRLCGMKASGRF